MFDLAPATRTLTTVVAGITEDQLGGPTPCADYSVADLLDHVDGLALAFAEAAAKTATGDQVPEPSGDRLDSQWRERIPARLADLAAAWREESAWSGMTSAGGVELPGEVAALVAANEVIVHGWDLAAATGQSFTVDPELLAAARQFVQSSVDESPEGTPGLFGPPVRVAEDAPPVDRLIGLSGRDPAWQPE